MREVIVIGGGLSGLSAAIELQKRDIGYTLIEVKSRLGGSIHSLKRSGFTFDSGPMIHRLRDPAAFRQRLADLELLQAVTWLDDDRLVFNDGTQALTDTVAAVINAPIMYRMAVSTLGRFDPSRFAVCLENGLLLDTRSLIVAVPARHAERLFHTLTPEISYQLGDYRYDTITRISAGYSGNQHLSTQVATDYPVSSLECIDIPQRAPDGAIVQAALRVAEHDLPDDPVGELAALMGWPLNPDADHIATWPESDPIMWRSTDHPEKMDIIRHLLPPGVFLIGSDYIPTAEPPRIDERIAQGVEAARGVAEHLLR
jgi:monoamine oxidase